MGTSAIDMVASRFAVQEISNQYLNFLINLSQDNSGNSQGLDK
jgi:hypothetical protein